MDPLKAFFPLPSALLGICSLAGCGGAEGAADHPETFPVSGIVTYQDKPLAGARVTFNPPTETGFAAFGTTDDAGRYSLTSFEPTDGAVPGTYIVTVTKFERAKRAPDASGDEYVPPEASGARPKAAKSLLPQKYATMAASDLKKTVAEEENEIDITLSE